MKHAIALGLLACLLTCGCIDSQNPLSDPKAAKIDERLVGLWRDMSGGSETCYHIGAAGGKYPAGFLRIIEITHDGDKLDPPQEFVGFSTTLEGKTYLSVVINPEKVRAFNKTGWKPEEVDGYFLVKYQIDGDKATLWTLDLAAKEKAINTGKIKGIVKDRNAHFTETSESVARLITSSGDSLWNADSPGHMVRVTFAAKP